jgi:hypothetical protein
MSAAALAKADQSTTNDFLQWLIKKDKAALKTGATASANGWV